MKRDQSAYLDALRALAALTVFLGHLSFMRLSGGALWQAQLVSHDAVVVFFVLSGFVIQHTVMVKYQDWRSYSVARLARLYSVALPALVLTAVCDAWGTRIDTAPYIMAHQSGAGLRMWGNLTMLSQSWGWAEAAFSNDAYWSLPYEFWYYQLFGGWLFLRGRVRLAWLVVCAGLAGPAIWLYMPVWICGVLARRAMGTRPLSQTHGRWWFAVSAAVLLVVLGADLRGAIERTQDVRWPFNYAWVDHVMAVAVAVNLYAAAFVSWPWARWARRPASLAGWSFSLYLFHMPLLSLLAALTPRTWPMGARALVLTGVTLPAVALLARYTEAKKVWWARHIDRLLPGRSTRRA